MTIDDLLVKNDGCEKIGYCPLKYTLLARRAAFVTSVWRDETRNAGLMDMLLSRDDGGGKAPNAFRKVVKNFL